MVILMLHKKKLLVIGPKAKSATTKLILEESAKVFDVSFAPIQDITLTVANNKIKIEYEGKDLTKIDYLLPKIDGRRKDYGFQIMNAFDAYPIKKPYSAATVLVAHDKFITAVTLARCGIPTPITYLLKSKDGTEALIDKVKFPLMVKLMSGSGGVGIMYVDNKEAMRTIIASMGVLNQQILIQEFIENPGEDIRILVAEDTVIGAYKRVAKKGEKRANIKSGGTAERYEPTEEMNRIAIKTAKVLHADICAIDLLESKSGPVVIEANINPGIRGMMDATNINIAKRIIDYLESKME
ncbi:RimK family alpha-L-glutamate ligase [archaeon]|nr:RimK family alpha-L-glutamate ligase [archaeon]